MNVIIKRSDTKGKKFDAVINDKKVIHFGQAGASDFTQHKNQDRKNNYIQRHKKNEQWNNPLTAGFYSRWITWEKPTLKEAVSNVNRKFKNINVKLKV
jgi:hypothetical protein